MAVAQKKTITTFYKTEFVEKKCVTIILMLFKLKCDYLIKGNIFKILKSIMVCERQRCIV